MLHKRVCIVPIQHPYSSGFKWVCLLFKAPKFTNDSITDYDIHPVVYFSTSAVLV